MHTGSKSFSNLFLIQTLGCYGLYIIFLIMLDSTGLPCRLTMLISNTVSAVLCTYYNFICPGLIRVIVVPLYLCCILYTVRIECNYIIP